MTPPPTGGVFASLAHDIAYALLDALATEMVSELSIDANTMSAILSDLANEFQGPPPG